MNEHLDDFLSYIGSEKGLSLNTIQAYQFDLIHLLNFLEGKVSAIQEVTHDLLIDHLSVLHAQGYATSSISRAVIALKVFFRFLKREGIVSANVALYLDSPKLWQMIPEVLTVEEVEALLEQPQLSDWVGSRDRAILELMYSSGLRVSEVCTVQICDVGDDCVRVFGKGSKERLIPVGKCALEAIDHYLMYYRCLTESEECQTLFVSKRGRPLDRTFIWRMIKHYGKLAGITKNISPHTLRHSFATHLLDNGAELRIIQEMLGHSDIKSTDRYTHISQQHMRDAFEKFHPAGSR